MEKELNIAAILKEKPKGVHLHDLLRNKEVKFDYIANLGDEITIWCNDYTNTKNKYYDFGYSECGTVRGYLDGLQILKPSKEMQDWSKFAWKKGDVLILNGEEKPIYCIFETFEDDEYTLFKSRFACSDEGRNNWLQFNTQSFTRRYEKASDDEAKEFIKKVEEHYEGKLNISTLEIERKSKQEFKDGDIVVLDEITSQCYAKCILIIKNIEDGKIGYNAFINLFTKDVQLNGVCFDKRSPRLATDSEKQQLFEALAKEGKRWNADKKQLVDLPKKCEFKAFDKCIWKNKYVEGAIWAASFVSYVDERDVVPMGVPIDEDLVNIIVLPYNDQTAHLLGTTDEWKGGEG